MVNRHYTTEFGCGVGDKISVTFLRPGSHEKITTEYSGNPIILTLSGSLVVNKGSLRCPFAGTRIFRIVRIEAPMFLSYPGHMSHLYIIIYYVTSVCPQKLHPG